MKELFTPSSLPRVFYVYGKKSLTASAVHRAISRFFVLPERIAFVPSVDYREKCVHVTLTYPEQEVLYCAYRRYLAYVDNVSFPRFVSVLVGVYDHE